MHAPTIRHAITLESGFQARGESPETDHRGSPRPVFGSLAHWTLRSDTAGVVKTGLLSKLHCVQRASLRLLDQSFGFRAGGCAVATEIMRPAFARDCACTGTAAAVGSTVRSLSTGMDRVVSRKAFMGNGCWLDVAGGGGVLVPLLTAAGTCTSPQSNRQNRVLG